MAYPRHPLSHRKNSHQQEIDPASRRGDSSRRLSCRSRVPPSLSRYPLALLVQRRRRRPLLPVSVFVLLEVAKRNGEARELDEERERAREREERERVRKVGKGGCGRKKRERDGSFEGLPRRGSQDLKKIGGE